MKLTKDEEKLLNLLKVGRNNIKTTKLLLLEMQIENTSKGVRYFRELIRKLRMRNCNANGYFIAETTNEIMEYIAPISSQIKQEKQMLKVIKTSSLEKWKKLLKGA